MYDVATQAKIYEFRQKAIAGTLTVEDEIEAVKILSAGRRSAAVASSTAKTKRVATAKVTNLDGDALLAELMGDMP